ncbi:MAG: polysaccharide biosynthesis tyrosine autokinase [Acidimicrobiales bacterium]
MIPQSDSTELDRRGYVAVVQRRKLTILLAVVVVVASSITFSLLQTPVYQASAKVLLQRPSSGEIFTPQPVVDVSTEIEVMQSNTVREAVAEELGAEPQVVLAAVADTSVVAISAESTVPAEAARIANTYADIYVSSRQEQRVADLLEAAEQVQMKVDEVDQQIIALEQPLADLDGEIAAASSPADRQELQAERASVNQEVAGRRLALQTQRLGYTEQLDDLQLARNLSQQGGAEVVNRAVEPALPVRPTPVRNGVLALVVGLMFGVGVAFLREHLDDTVKNKNDLDRATGGLSVLAIVPLVGAWKDRAAPRVVSLTQPNSHAAEAYRSLRTSVQFIGLDHPVQVIQLTSPNASEGKTTTLANLGVALANSGQRVIIVCCDLRRPRIHEFFGLTNTIGFTSVLLGELPLSAAIQPVPDQPRLALLASGPPPPNPSELLASRRTGEVLLALKSECDVVLVDSPPVLPVTDAIVLSRTVDATILVGTAARTTKKEYHRAVELLQQVEAPLIGSVLNGVESEDLYGYGYGYGYYGFGQTGLDIDDGSSKLSRLDIGDGAPTATGVSRQAVNGQRRRNVPRRRRQPKVESGGAGRYDPGRKAPRRS